MSNSPPQLDYAPFKSSRRRRWLRGLVLLVLLLLAVRASLPLLRQEVQRQHLLKLYDACTHIIPTNIAHSHAPGQTSFAVPSDWGALNAALSTNINSSGTIFLGKLRTPDGTRELLVGVDLFSWSNAPMIVNGRARTIARGGHLGTPRYATSSDPSVFIARSVNKLVIHGGVRDAADASHFTVAYEADDQPGIIDGWLKNDETVVLETRFDASPATAPARPSPASSR